MRDPRLVSLRVASGALVAALILFVAGCGTTRTYPGARRPATEVGIIVGQSRILPGLAPIPGAQLALTSLISVDGVAIGPAIVKVEVLPGLHTLEVKCKVGQGKKETIEIYVNAGYTYVLAANYYPGTQECRAFVNQEAPL